MAKRFDSKINEGDIEKTILLSVYIDFTQLVKSQHGWQLLPGQEFRYFNTDTGIKYGDIREFAEFSIIRDINFQLEQITNNETIRISYNKTRNGSIELLLSIYGVYASIADFIETTKIIREFINSQYHTRLNTHFGSYFYVNTTILNPPSTPIGKNIGSAMIILTIFVSIFTTATLYYFSFGFISDVIANSLIIAFFISMIIEFSKVLTSFYLVELKESNRIDNKKWLISIRVIAILLSSVFCLSEITKKNTAPNLSEFREKQLTEYKKEFESDSLDICNSYDNRISQKTADKNGIVVGANIVSRSRSIDFTPMHAEKRRLETDIERLQNEKLVRQEQNRKRIKEEIDKLMRPDFSTAEANNQKINSILQTVFNIKPDSENYKNNYQLFVVLSAIFITLLIEMISIVSIQNISYYFLRR